MLLIVLYKLK